MRQASSMILLLLLWAGYLVLQCGFEIGALFSIMLLAEAFLMRCRT